MDCLSPTQESPRRHGVEFDEDAIRLVEKEALKKAGSSIGGPRGTLKISKSMFLRRLPYLIGAMASRNSIFPAIPFPMSPGCRCPSWMRRNGPRRSMPLTKEAHYSTAQW